MAIANNYNGDLKDFLRYYRYQPKLTEYLDEIKNMEFNENMINEIVLWKVNRHVKIEENTLDEINSLNKLSNGQHRKSESILKKIMNIKGIDLPMASTILRFKNPEVFQIIDKHAYRAIYDKKYPCYPSSNVEKKIDIYFNYLDKLIELCKARDLEFYTIDRLLYIYDKKINGKL